MYVQLWEAQMIIRFYSVCYCDKVWFTYNKKTLSLSSHYVIQQLYYGCCLLLRISTEKRQTIRWQIIIS